MSGWNISSINVRSGQATWYGRDYYTNTSAVPDNNTYANSVSPTIISEAQLAQARQDMWEQARIHFQQMQFNEIARLNAIHDVQAKKLAIEKSIELLDVLIENMKTTEAKHKDTQDMIDKLITFYELYQINMKRELDKCTT